MTAPNPSPLPAAPGPARAPLMPLEEALQRLLAQAAPLGRAESVSCFDADARVLAQDVVSGLQVPPHDNSAMDGYAVRCADLPQAGGVLQVTQRIPAGSTGKALEPLSAARIFTGAPIPPGADAVVMQEDCEVVNECEGGVRVNVLPQLGQHIRRSGEDVCQGSLVLQKGERLTPASIGLAASVGLASLQVAVRPRVALFSTGDELVMPGSVAPQDMPPGAIYNSNRFFLRALLQRLGCAVTDMGIVPDQREATIAALRQASAAHDLVLTSGGVSVGEEDHVKPAVQSLGQLDLWQIGMKPGKPFAYGSIRREASGKERGAEPSAEGANCHFIGLPGNPVSSFVTFLLLVRPFVLRLAGQSQLATASIALPAHFTLPRGDKRREFLRVRRNAAGGLDLFANQSSGVLTSAVWADGLVDNPPGRAIAQGDMLRFISFTDLLA